MPAQVTPEYAWKPLRYKRNAAGEQYNIDPRAAWVAMSKEITLNIEQRQRILLQTDKSHPEHLANREAWLKACRDSFLVFLNLFVWTFVLVRHTHQGRRMEKANIQPFVSYPVQDDAAEVLIRSTGIYDDPGETVIIDKSREMGATWLSLAIIVWLFLFHRNTTTLMCADRAESVDFPGRPKGLVSADAADKDTLFGKIDFIIDLLPGWMTVGLVRTHMNFANPAMGTRIDGSTTRDDLGRGGRRTVLFIDEATAIRQLKSIDKSTQDTAPCRWFNATPKGAHYFTELRTGGKARVVVMGWWDHPLKGCEGPNGEPGRYIAFDPDKGEEVITGWWRELEKIRRQSIQDVAENIDIDHMGAGRVVFDLGVLNRHLSTWCYPAQHRLRVVHALDGHRRTMSLQKRVLEHIVVEEAAPSDSDRGILHWWGELVNGRPPQDGAYVLAADVSGGNGASNSVIAIGNAATGEKVGEWYDSNASPDDLAYMLAMIGLWVGGQRGHGFVIWEANGPGNRVGRVLVSLHYPWLYVMKSTTKKYNRIDKEKRLGWWNSDQTVRDAAESLRAAYAAGHFVNHSELAVQETMKWVRYENNKIGPGPLEFETQEAKKTHGDRTVADMLLWKGMSEYMLDAPTRVTPPPDSPAADLLALGEDLGEMLDRLDKEEAADVV